MLISNTIPNLVNGVSQQPEALRLASQAEAQENFLSSVVEGLKRRPSSRHIAKLTSSTWASAFLHMINRDTTERYAVSVFGGDLKVYDLLDGSEVTVNFPDGKGYLTAPSRSDFRAVTIADYTFLVNRSVTVAMDAALTPDRNPQALIHIAGANYSKTFEVTLDGVLVASHETPDGSAGGHVAQVATDFVTDAIMTELTANVTDPKWSVTQVSNVIVIENLNGEEFTIETTDGFNNVYMSAVKEQIQRFSDLPSHAPVGFQCEVVGEASSTFDNYYVEWDADVGSETTGVWKESIKWNIPFSLDASTMPHVLVRESDGTFTFKQADWEDRIVGDEDSSPEPSFVGKTLNDVFFFKNRLGVSSGENVVMSRSGDFFNFWSKTVTTLVDTDPIDIGVSHVKVSSIEHAVPFNQSLLLFSDQTQFILGGGDILTPSTVSVSQTTEFEGSADVRPVAAGPNVYFPVARGAHSGIREYFVEADTLTNNATDITSHCPKYLPSDLFLLASSSNEDMLIALCGSDPSSMYVYKYFYGQDGKLQSSWSRWSFEAGSSILHCSFIENNLYALIERADGVFLEVVDIASGAADEGSEFLYRIDRRVYESDLPSPVFDGTYTTWTLPYETDEDLWVFTRVGDSLRPEGYVLIHDRPTSSTVRVSGDWTGSKVCFGVRFESIYEFSTFLIKEQVPGGGQSSIGEGRLQILHLALDYDQSGYFTVNVTPTGRDTFIYKFTGRILGSVKNILASAGLETGRFKLPVMSRNREVKVEIRTDHFLPCSFMSAEWEGRYTTRSRRL